MEHLQGAFAISSYSIEKPNFVKPNHQSIWKYPKWYQFVEIPNNDHRLLRILRPKWINLFLRQECHHWILKLHENGSWSMWKDENEKIKSFSKSWFEAPKRVFDLKNKEFFKVLI